MFIVADLASLNLIKIYHVVQELYEHFTNLLRTDGRTRIVIIVQTQGSCNYTLMACRIGNVTVWSPPIVSVLHPFFMISR